MTVVAYSSRHRILAADSRCFDHHTESHVTEMEKIYRLKNGALLGIAGGVDVRDLCALLGKSTPRRMPSRQQLADLKDEHDAILVFPKGQVWTIEIEYDKKSGGWRGEALPIRDSIVAIGSGAAYAYGAMEAGADPVKAVRAACRRDLFCGGRVRRETL